MSHQIFVTGAEGQLGFELCRQLGPKARALSRADLDIAEVAQVESFFDRSRPAAIVNCAAYTAVDRAEAEPERCRAVNAKAVEQLARAADKVGAVLVQISSDYVFGGDANRTRPYLETDCPSPQGVYAQSKLLGEQAAQSCPRHIVVRTCGLYGQRTKAGQSNFVDTMLRLAKERRRIRVVGDQRCTPSAVVDVAAAIRFLIEREAHGTFHVVNQGETTWYDFARRIFLLRGLVVQLERITTEEYGAAAPRPRYSVLNTEEYRALGGPVLPTWEEALERYLQQAS